MRSFLLAFVCLSTPAAAQNMLAISPAEHPRVARFASVEGRVLGAAFGEAGSARSAPEPSTMGLLFVGLAGLTAAGSRVQRSRVTCD